MAGFSLAGRTVPTRAVLVALNSASIAALLAGYRASSRFKACDEARTRQVFYQQHEATASAVGMMLSPKKADAKTGDYQDDVYEVVERARRSRARFVRYLDDESCSRLDKLSQTSLFLSAALQILSGLLAVLKSENT